jgi:hypothetical protein
VILIRRSRNLLRGTLRRSRPPGGGDRLPRLRRVSVKLAERRRMKESMDGQTAEGGKERRREAVRSKGSGHQEQAAAERPGVQPGRPPTSPTADGGSAARDQRASTSGAAPRSSARHATGQAAAHLAKPGVQPGAESDGASGDAGAVCAASPRASIALCQHRSEGGSPSHAGGRQRRAGHGPERWHHRPRSGAERRERPSRERDGTK